MELWIRSQDREHLKKINTGLYLKQGLSDYAKGEVIFITSSGDDLGEYETKERALEVLDEIQEAKLGNFHYSCPSNVEASNKEDTIVYKMPKE